MKKYYISLILTLAFFLSGIITISDYGINWDTPIRLIRGQAALRFILGKKLDYDHPALSVSAMLVKDKEYISRFDFLEGEMGELAKLPKRPVLLSEHQKLQEKAGIKFSFYEDNWWNGDYWKDNQTGHPALPNTASALTNKIFYQWLGWLKEIESYNLIHLLFSSIGVFVVTIFTYELTKSGFAAFIAGISLAFFPLFFAESHFNMKDPPQASFFAGSIWAFWHFVKDNSKKWFVIFLIFALLALTVKWNVVFLPLILGPWLISIRKYQEFKNWFNIKRFAFYILLFVVLSILFINLVEPYNLLNPLKVIGNITGNYLDIGIRPEPLQPPGFILPPGFNIYPLLLLLFQTPETVLLLALVGGWALNRGFIKDLKVGILLFLWLLVPLLRVSLPHLWFYNGLRQIMEILPVLAILAGLGAYYLSKKYKVKSVKWVIMGLVLFLLLGTTFKYHPNENVYFNYLVGGLKGAVGKNLVESKISYGNIYKQAADWLNKNAEKDANIAFLDGPMYALSPLLLRPDISISPFHFSGLEQKGEYILALFNPNLPNVFAARYPGIFLKPLHQIIVDSVPMMVIYKNEPKYSKFDLAKEQSVDANVVIKRVNTGIYSEIDLGKTVKVTRVVLTNMPGYCAVSYAQFIDEFILFDSGREYGLQERRKTENSIEFWFPGEETRYIKIYPQSRFSCFKGGKISFIVYL